MEKKVLVACPTADVKDYCFDDYMKSVLSLSYDNYDILIVDNSESRAYYDELKNKYGEVAMIERVNPSHYPNFKTALAKSHDNIRKKAIEGKYDYLLHLESDIFPPKDIIDVLISRKKGIVGAMYHVEEGADSKLMIQLIEDFGDSHRESFNLDETDIDFVDGEVKQVFSCGIGCILIHKKMLDKFVFRYENGIGAHPDSFLFNDLHHAQIKVFIDTSVICEHKNTSLLRL